MSLIPVSILDAKVLAGPADGSFVPAKDAGEPAARLEKVVKDDGVAGMAAVIADRGVIGYRGWA